MRWRSVAIKLTLKNNVEVSGFICPRCWVPVRAVEIGLPSTWLRIVRWLLGQPIRRGYVSMLPCEHVTADPVIIAALTALADRVVAHQGGLLEDSR